MAAGWLLRQFEGVPAPEVIFTLAARPSEEGSAHTAGVLGHLMATGELERADVEEALRCARDALERNGWLPDGDDGPNLGQAVVILSRLLR